VKSFVLRLDARDSEREYQILRAIEAIPIPTPRVYGWDAAGEALGVPCFFCDYIEGQLKAMYKEADAMDSSERIKVYNIG